MESPKIEPMSTPDKSSSEKQLVHETNENLNNDADKSLLKDETLFEQMPQGHESAIYRWSPGIYLQSPWKTRDPFLATGIACMGGLLFGFMSNNVGPFIGTGTGSVTDNPPPPNPDGRHGYTYYFGYGSPPTISAIHQAGITASFGGGAFIGSLISSGIADRVGRRSMMQIICFLWLIGSAIQCAANNRAALCWGRIIAGAGVGMASSNVPLYLSELAPTKIRSRLVSCFQLAVCLGILIMYFISYGSSKLEGESSFRLAFGLQMVPGFIMLIGSMFLCESPRWLASIGHWQESKNTLCFLRKADPDNADVAKELNDYGDVIRAENSKPTTVLDLFKGTSLNRSVSAISSLIWQQLLGSNAVLYYTSTIIIITGQGASVFRFSVIMYCILVGMTLFAVICSDRWSRRWGMMCGAFWQMTCMAILSGLVGHFGESTGPGGYGGNNPTIRQYISNLKAGKAALAFSYLYFAGYACTWGPLPWVYVSEMFPSNQRGIGNGLGSAANWLFNFVLSIFVPSSFINITYKTYVIFTVFAFVSMFQIFVFFPETKGHSLEEMELLTRNAWPLQTDPVYLWFRGIKNSEDLEKQLVKEDEGA